MENIMNKLDNYLKNLNENGLGEKDIKILLSITNNLYSSMLKIYEPTKHHHWEEDAYTRAGCFQFVAQESLKDCEKIIIDNIEEWKLK